MYSHKNLWRKIFAFPSTRRIDSQRRKKQASRSYPSSQVSTPKERQKSTARTCVTLPWYWTFVPKVHVEVEVCGKFQIPLEDARVEGAQAGAKPNTPNMKKDAWNERKCLYSYDLFNGSWLYNLTVSISLDHHGLSGSEFLSWFFIIIRFVVCKSRVEKKCLIAAN